MQTNNQNKIKNKNKRIKREFLTSINETKHPLMAVWTKCYVSLKSSNLLTSKAIIKLSI